MDPGTARRVLVLLLRIGGVMTGSAFLAVLLPVDWMAATHDWLGLGEFPRSPIVDYLTRSAAALYGFHGVMLLVIARDPERHRPLIRALGVMNIVLGALLLGIDLHAGLPLYWTLMEGPPVAAFGVAMLALSRNSYVSQPPDQI